MNKSNILLALFASAICGSTLADVTCAIDTPDQTGGSWDVLCSDDGSNTMTTKYWCNVGINITTSNSADAANVMVNGNVAQGQQNAGIWFAAMYNGDNITNVQLGEVDCDAQDD